MKELLESFKYIFKEHRDNKSRIWEMSKVRMKQQTLRTTFGMGWVFFKDIIYFAVFTIFRTLISGTGEVEGMNFILYLIAGLVPWNFMSEVINSGTNAIINNSPILHSIKFPITILPTIEVTAIFLKRLFTLIVLFIIVAIFGNIWDINIFLLSYYFIAMYIFMCCYNLVFSAILSVSFDLRQFYQAITSVLFYTMPILWSFERIQSNIFISRLLKLNPFTYIIIGFRDAVALGNMPDLEYTLYFWFIALMLITFGSFMQYKLKRYYQDFI